MYDASSCRSMYQRCGHRQARFLEDAVHPKGHATNTGVPLIPGEIVHNPQARHIEIDALNSSPVDLNASLANTNDNQSVTYLIIEA